MPTFERHRKDYLDDDAFSRSQEALMGNPKAADLNKVRVGDSRRAKGKRGVFA